MSAISPFVPLLRINDLETVVEAVGKFPRDAGQLVVAAIESDLQDSRSADSDDDGDVREVTSLRDALVAACRKDEVLRRLIVEQTESVSRGRNLEDRSFAEDVVQAAWRLLGQLGPDGRTALLRAAADSCGTTRADAFAALLKTARNADEHALVIDLLLKGAPFTKSSDTCANAGRTWQLWSSAEVLNSLAKSGLETRTAQLLRALEPHLIKRHSTGRHSLLSHWPAGSEKRIARRPRT